jgi:AcrR family transcriptional regulator
MTTRPFHHGNLRSVLLEEGESMLREGGADAISLRELARRADVSHGAPRSHFIDRQSLLDALAERGFDRLAANVSSAASRHNSFEDRFRAVAHAYVDFAVDDAALMELMFAAKMNEPPELLQAAAARLFGTFDELMPIDGDEESQTHFKLLFAATMQGTATLIAARRISHGQGDAVIEDAIDTMLGSDLAARALPQR